MKKLILSTTFLVAGTFSILAQGLVDFHNEYWQFPDTFDRLIYLGSIAPGNEIKDDKYTAALFENRGGTWTQLGDRSAFYGNIPTFEGVIANDGVQRVISLPAGQATSLQIRIYDATGAELQLSAGNNTFPYTMGTAQPPGPTDTLMVGLRAFAVVVPEPSTIALGVLGLGALLLFRRRK